ncbi:hypothetical protein [Deinococcus sp. UYEF24]
MKPVISTVFSLVCTVLVSTGASAEHYNVTAKFEPFQPAEFRVSINGRPVALMHNINSSLDITSLLQKGKNTVVVTSVPGKSVNRFSKSTLTIGAGAEGKFKTLFNREVGPDSKAGSVTYTFVADPSENLKAGKVSLIGKFHPFQPAEFQVSLNGESVTTINSDGNSDLTALLKPGKNLLTVKYTAGKNTNNFSQSVLTVGEQRGEKWNSVVKWAVGKGDTTGSFSFPIYR